jgi:uncharacterized membrane protein YgaE (UPF0421/DUF939 family)
MLEDDNILRIFRETKTAIENNEITKLRDLSNQTVHTSSISQDSDNIAVAVIVYSLSKIIEKGYLDIKKKKRIIEIIDKLILSIEKKDEKSIKNILIDLRNNLEEVSGDIKNYIQDVFRKASINKASKIYEHGISMEKTASLLGITMFELADYAGQRESISEVFENKTINNKSRIKLAMNIFRK